MSEQVREGAADDESLDIVVDSGRVLEVRFGATRLPFRVLCPAGGAQYGSQRGFLGIRAVRLIRNRARDTNLSPGRRSQS